MNTLSIKQMAERTGLSTYTLRYYEQEGLLDGVQRDTNGHRRYTAYDVDRIDFLMKLRTTGMPIREMQYFVALYRSGDDTTPERCALLQAHRQRVQAQIDELCANLAVIDRKIDMYLQEEECQP